MSADIENKYTFSVLEFHKRCLLFYIRAKRKAIFSVFVNEHIRIV